MSPQSRLLSWMNPYGQPVGSDGSSRYQFSSSSAECNVYTPPHSSFAKYLTPPPRMPSSRIWSQPQSQLKSRTPMSPQEISTFQKVVSVVQSAVNNNEADKKVLDSLNEILRAQEPMVNANSIWKFKDEASATSSGPKTMIESFPKLRIARPTGIRSNQVPISTLQVGRSFPIQHLNPKPQFYDREECARTAGHGYGRAEFPPLYEQMCQLCFATGFEAHPMEECSLNNIFER